MYIQLRVARDGNLCWLIYSLFLEVPWTALFTISPNNALPKIQSNTMYLPRNDHSREGSTAPGVGSGTEAGASGSSSSGGYSISTGGLIAIVVVVVAVAILGGEFCLRNEECAA